MFPNPVHITFAGLQQSLQMMFDNRKAELDDPARCVSVTEMDGWRVIFSCSDQAEKPAMDECSTLQQKGTWWKSYGSITEPLAVEVGREGEEGGRDDGWKEGVVEGDWAFDPMAQTPVRVRTRTTSRDKIEKARHRKASLSTRTGPKMSR